MCLGVWRLLLLLLITVATPPFQRFQLRGPRAGGLVSAAVSAPSTFPRQCPSVCQCSWYDGKRGARCHSRQVSTLPAGLSNDLQILDVSDAAIVQLDQDAFLAVGLEHLHRFVAKDAGLQRLHRHTFRGVLGLNVVDLSDNQLTQLDSDLFSGNDKLQHVTLSGNPLQSLGRYQFPPLPMLQSLKLARCRLTSISAKAFANLATLSQLDLSGNRLATLQSEALQSLTQLQSLMLAENPWRCDCHLRLFRDWLFDRRLYMKDAQCAEPERLAAKRWHEAQSSDFACRPQIHVPQPTVVARRGDNVTLRCQISGNPSPKANWVQHGRVLSNGTQVAWEAAAAAAARFDSTVAGGGGVGGGGASSAAQRYTILSDGTVNHWINLTITGASDRDLGQYLCMGVNAGGMVERNVSLVFDASSVAGAGGSDGDIVGGGGGLAGLGRRLLSGWWTGVIAAATCLLLLLIVVVCVCCCCWGGRKQQQQRANGMTQSVQYSGGEGSFGGGGVGGTLTSSRSKLCCTGAGGSGGDNSAAAGGVMVIGGVDGGCMGDDKLMSTPLYSSTPCAGAGAGGYRPLPQCDITDLTEMQPRWYNDGASGGGGGGDSAAASATGTLRRLSLPNSKNAAAANHSGSSWAGGADFPDLLHVPQSPSHSSLSHLSSTLPPVAGDSRRCRPAPLLSSSSPASSSSTMPRRLPHLELPHHQQQQQQQPGRYHHHNHLGYSTPRSVGSVASSPSTASTMAATAGLMRPGYVTLPRRPRTPSWGGGVGVPLLGSSPAVASGGGAGSAVGDSVADPVYDSLGPRTTVDGSSRLSLTSAGTGDRSLPRQRPQHHLHQRQPQHQQRSSTPDGSVFFMDAEMTPPPPPPEFSTLPRNIRLASLTPLTRPTTTAATNNHSGSPSPSLTAMTAGRSPQTLSTCGDGRLKADSEVAAGAPAVAAAAGSASLTNGGANGPAMRPRSLSTDIIEPLQEVPDEVDEPPSTDLTRSDCSGTTTPSAQATLATAPTNGSHDSNHAPLTTTAAAATPNNTQLTTPVNGKLKPPNPPPKPLSALKIPPPVLPKPQRNGTPTTVQREDGTEL